jgi:hypothetical protein
MTDPHHETALMLLRAAGFEDDEAKVALAERGLGWSMFRSDLIAMAAAVDAKMEAREKVLREALKAAHDAIAQIQSEYILGGYCQELLGAAEELVDAALEAKP